MRKFEIALKILRSLFFSIYFNFKYLPFDQAYKLPILLFKPKLLKCKGKITIKSDNIKFGMIRLGWDSVSIYYPNNKYGIIFENHGGEIIFEEDIIIGSGSALSIGSTALLTICRDSIFTANARIVCYNNIYYW